jgi:hypothetical protein
VRLSHLKFEDWIEHAFSHEVRWQKPAWFFDDDADFWAPEPAEAIACLTRLFESSTSVLQYFSDDQVAQGLTYLLSTSASGDNGWFYSRDVPTTDRVRCVRSIERVFSDLFLPRCTPHLGHLSEPAGALNLVCYMWWDEFPCIALPDDPELKELHGAALNTMRAIAHLDSLACQESALHGLGHWQRHDPERVCEIVDEFLRTHPQADQRLVTYAQSARCGCIL